MNKSKITNRKRLSILIISAFSFYNCVAQSNNETFNFNSPNTNYALALNSTKTQTRFSAFAKDDANCSKYLKKKKFGNILKLSGGGAFVLGAIVAIAGGSEGDDEALIGGNVLMVAGVGSAVTGFIIKGKAKRGLKKNDCVLNLQLKGTSIGLALNF